VAAQGPAWQQGLHSAPLRALLAQCQQLKMVGIDADTISLRPLSLRPGGVNGSNPFAGFSKGAGVGLKNKVRWTGVCPGRAGTVAIASDHAGAGR
jgi:hypothetical protein